RPPLLGQRPWLGDGQGTARRLGAPRPLGRRSAEVGRLGRGTGVPYPDCRRVPYLLRRQVAAVGARQDPPAADAFGHARGADAQTEDRADSHRVGTPLRERRVTKPRTSLKTLSPANHAKHAVEALPPSCFARTHWRDSRAFFYPHPRSTF